MELALTNITTTGYAEFTIFGEYVSLLSADQLQNRILLMELVREMGVDFHLDSANRVVLTFTPEQYMEYKQESEIEVDLLDIPEINSYIGKIANKLN